MLLQKGIVRKTFLFSSLLIVLVLLISFAAMYFIMPDYYLKQKRNTMMSNFQVLSDSLQAASSDEECAALISVFSEANNVDVYSFDKNDAILPMLSTPFVNMKGNRDTFFIDGGKTAGTADGQVKIQIRTERILGDAAVMENDAQKSAVTIKWAPIMTKNDMLLYRQVESGFIDHIMASGKLQPIDEAKGVILSLIPYVMAIAVVVGIILAGTYARQITKPILQISDAALRMQRMEPDALSAIKTKDELGQLSANLDFLYTSLLENIDHLKSEMEKVNRLERSKTEMMQSASHELKTPIAALGGMLEGMMDNIGVYKDRDKYLAECKGQVNKLSMLVGEILGASKADVTCDEIELSDTFVNDLVERAISENTYYIHENELELIQQLQLCTITTDANTLYRIISNLISNAVRYTPNKGKIRIDITESGEERWLSIENECEPIPQDELPKLFEPFYTRSYSRDKTKSGTGLGLYIVRRSLEQLEIPYRAENSELGFKVSLQLQA